MTSRKSWSSFFKDDAKLSSSAKSDLAKDNFKAENVFKRQHGQRNNDTTDVTSAQRKRRSGRGHVASNFWQLDKRFGDKEPGKLISGSSIAICPNQDVAVVDLSAKRINVYSKSGEYQHSFLTNQGPNALTEQCYPRQVTVNALGMFFVTDETPWIKMFNSHGDFVHDFPVVVPQCKTAVHSDSLCPIGLALDVNGVLFIGEVNNKYICRQQSDGTFINNFKVSIEPVVLAVTSAGEVIICGCHMDADVQLVDSSGQLLQTFNSELLYTLRSSVERLTERNWYPTGVFYHNGVIYISNFEIYCFSIVPDKGTLAACVTKDVTTPVGLTVTEDDKEFKLLVVDENGSCVKVFTIDK